MTTERMAEAAVPATVGRLRAGDLARLVLHQFRFDLLAFVRNRRRGLRSKHRHRREQRGQ